MRKLISHLAVRALLITDAPTLFHKFHGFAWYGGILRTWTRTLGLSPGARILEIGSGPGGLSRDLAMAGYRVTGVDRSGAMIRRARRAAKSLENVDFHQSDAFHLPFEAHSFDAVIAASVMNVVRDKRALILEMARVVSPNGVVSVLFPTPDLTPLRAEAFAQRHDLDAFHGAMLGLWAQKAPKLERAEAVALFREAALDKAASEVFLEGFLMSVTHKTAHRAVRP